MTGNTVTGLGVSGLGTEVLLLVFHVLYAITLPRKF
jgi:hypothetical protein